MSPLWFSSPKLTDHKFLIFDVYGTLIDWESGIYTALQPLLSCFTSSAQWSRKDVIRKFISVETEIQAKYPNMAYSELLAEVHKALEKELRADSSQSADGDPSTTHDESCESSTSTTPENLHTEFARSIKYWTPFPDSSSALHTLAKHFKLIVLSNVDYTSFADSHAYLSEGLSPSPSPSPSDPSAPTSHNTDILYARPTTNSEVLWLPRTTPGSKSPFSLIMTAQDAGAYKSSLDGFNTVFKHVTTEPELHDTISELSHMKEDDAKESVKVATLIVAQSLTHDHVPAKKLGVRSVWIDREDAKMRPDDGEDQGKWGWKWKFATLGEMARAVEQEVQEDKKKK
jgi:FMN phosphatase YigB (HAD superfamily)